MVLEASSREDFSSKKKILKQDASSSVLFLYVVEP